MQGLLIQSLLLSSSEFESLDNILSNNLEDPLIIGFSHGRFDKSLDILNYGDKLTSTKPEKAISDNLFISYKYNKFKISYESISSTGTVQRQTQPKKLETDVQGSSLFLSYNFLENEKNNFEIGLFSKKEEQDPVTIDCYAFGSTVIGGSC